MKKLGRKTLFKKYLGVFMSIVLMSFLVLGIMLYVFVSNYKISEKKELLIKNANNIAATISDSGLEVETANKSINNSGEISYALKNEELLLGILNTVSQNLDSDIFITDSSGKILLFSNTDSVIDTQKVIPEQILSAVENGQYVGINHLGEIYSYNCYSVGIPIKANNKAGEKVVIGSVFIASDAAQMDSLGFEILKLFVFSALISLLIALLIIWLLSYNMAKPLKQMSEAAKSFSQGDFSKRVFVKSNDEIGSLAIAFNEMAESLEFSEKTRKNFIANVSHELKTPMTTIAGFIDGILDGTIKEEKQTYYLNIVSSEIKRLSRLVQSMLNLSRIDSGKVSIKKTKFDLLALTLNVLSTFEKTIKEKNVEIKVLPGSDNVLVEADKDMLYQVVFNLVENATKFVNKHGFIEISLYNAKNQTIFSIKNSGDGISKEDIGLIFDRFYKTDKSRSLDKTGIGLGLYIVKKILQLHKGNIAATSIDGNSCVFEFFIPDDFGSK
ncbi:MAG: Adaptive-response sensory-kinase SasA [Eubacteriales bacterium SKADARSKE-1]|nr:Adaptive-response sensory-kinase SasA [Eubacteriales bacterium SKADARSKE-1]